jgi:hypothetical protein
VVIRTVDRIGNNLRGGGMRLRRLAMVGVALAPVLGMATTADAGEGGHRKKIAVQFSVENYNFEPIELPCDPVAPAACLIGYKVPGFQTFGDFVGTGVEAGTGAIANNLVTGRGTGVFTGRVKRCGTGSFVYTQSTTADLTTNDARTIYTISPGSGTGELEGITGTWENGIGFVRCHSD